MKKTFLFLLAAFILSSCKGAQPAINETWSLVELLSKKERIDTITETVRVRSCNGVENKIISCSAGTSNDIALSFDGDIGFGAIVKGTISSSVSAGLGINRESGESLELDTPAEGFIYEYTIKKEFTVLSGEVLSRSSSGKEESADYAYYASCTLHIESIDKHPCPEQTLGDESQDSLSELYDDFENDTFWESYNDDRWNVFRSLSNSDDTLAQSNGYLELKNVEPYRGDGLILYLSDWDNTSFKYFEADVMISKNGHKKGNVTLNAFSPNLPGGWTEFGLGVNDHNQANIHVFLGSLSVYSKPVAFDEWYTLRIEFDQENNSLQYLLNGEEIASSKLSSTQISSLTPGIQFWHNLNSETITAYIDNVKVSQ